MTEIPLCCGAGCWLKLEQKQLAVTAVGRSTRSDQTFILQTLLKPLTDGSPIDFEQNVSKCPFNEHAREVNKNPAPDISMLVEKKRVITED